MVICFSTLQIGSLIEAAYITAQDTPAQMFQYPSNRVVDRSVKIRNLAIRNHVFQYPSNRVVDRSVSKLISLSAALQVSVPFKSGR